MKIIRTARTLAALGLVLGFAAAHAAAGYNVSRDQESQITPGMTQSEVLTALGKPERDQHFGLAQGHTYTYRAVGPDEVFEVDFDAAGRVRASGRRVIDSN